MVVLETAALDALELLRMRRMCRRSLESPATAESDMHLEDRNYIDKLEKELRNCSQEIGYLQDQLNLKNVESNYMAEHVHSLELKLAETGKLNEKIRLLTEELVQSESQRLSLMQALRHREKELQTYAFHIEKLETSVSCISLDSECEVESMKLDLTALEQRCLEAVRMNQEAVHEKERLNELLEKYEDQFQESQQVISHLECENKNLQEKLTSSKTNMKGCFCKAVEQLDKWVQENCNLLTGQSILDLSHELRNNLTLSTETCACEEVLGPWLSKLAAILTRDSDIKIEMEQMSSRIHESELLVKQLKEELREEKLKAKEEAEDLVQEMAELRYQITGMLEEECKRRACIEQVSIQRIQELESQVREEQKKSNAALERFREAHDLAEMRSIELRQLKDELKKLESSPCEHCTSSENSSGCVRQHLQG